MSGRCGQRYHVGMLTRSLLSLRVFLLAAVGCTDPSESEVPDDTGVPGDSGALGGACVDPQSLLLKTGEPSGYEQCADGSVNRVSSEDFDIVQGIEACRGDEGDLNCHMDADCDAGAHGRCASLVYEWDTGNPDPSYCGCVYPCVNDADCPGEQACHPPEIGDGTKPYPNCESATCNTGEDCQSGECAFTTYDDGCGWSQALNCRRDDDQCRDDADCGGNDDGDQCAPTGEGGELVCSGDECDIGRPLLVHDVPRTAAAVSRAGWEGQPGRSGATWAAVVEDLGIGALSADERAVQARQWGKVAALEHASVGSFARFTMQLLALGAPAELLAGAQAAAADEVRHAQVAYGIVSAYAGEPIGPGSLALGDAMPALEPEGALRALINEACVGETLGAAEARAQAEGLPAGALQRVLLEIAEDESRHAALAWRTLKWMLVGNPEMAPLAREQFAVTLARYAASETPVHRAALRHVVVPLVASLVGPGLARDVLPTARGAEQEPQPDLVQE